MLRNTYVIRYTSFTLNCSVGVNYVFEAQERCGNNSMVGAIRKKNRLKRRRYSVPQAMKRQNSLLSSYFSRWSDLIASKPAIIKRCSDRIPLLTTYVFQSMKRLIALKNADRPIQSEDRCRYRRIGPLMQKQSFAYLVRCSQKCCTFALLRIKKLNKVSWINSKHTSSILNFYAQHIRNILSVSKIRWYSTRTWCGISERCCFSKEK